MEDEENIQYRMEDTPPVSYLGWADMESAPTGGIEGNERPIFNHRISKG